MDQQLVDLQYLYNVFMIECLEAISPLCKNCHIYGNKDRFSSEIYGASKAAVIQLTKYYSVILSKYNINVNCLSPGGIFNEKKPQSKFSRVLCFLWLVFPHYIDTSSENFDKF